LRSLRKKEKVGGELEGRKIEHFVKLTKKGIFEGAGIAAGR